MPRNLFVLSLDGLSSISPEAIKELARVEGYVILSLGGLTSITPEVARELAKLK
jgi:hypothetical protein